FQAEDGIRDRNVTGVQTCALPISAELRRGLRPSLRRVAADAGLRLGDGELDEVRQLDRDRTALDVEHVHLGVLLEPVARVADLRSEERRVGKERRCWGWADEE